VVTVFRTIGLHVIITSTFFSFLVFQNPKNKHDFTIICRVSYVFSNNAQHSLSHCAPPHSHTSIPISHLKPRFLPTSFPFPAIPPLPIGLSVISERPLQWRIQDFSKEPFKGLGSEAHQRGPVNSFSSLVITWLSMKCWRTVSCFAGSYQPSHVGEAEACLPCPVGQYQPRAHSDDCVPCPNGRTTLKEWSTSENQCKYDYLGTVVSGAYSIVLLFVYTLCTVNGDSKRQHIYVFCS